jgi:hypothetical protein
MHKNVAHAVVPQPIFFMGKIPRNNNALNAYNVIGYLFGNPKSIAPCDFGTGSNYGWLKTIPSDNYAKSPDTALLKSAKLRTTGLNKSHKRVSITLGSNI